MKNGVVTHVHPTKGEFILQIEATGEYAVFEFLGGIHIKVGDKLYGNLSALGGDIFIHQNGTKFTAYGQTGPRSLRECLAFH